MTKLLNLLMRAGVLSLALLLADVCQGASRVLRAQDMTITRGETNKLFISLEGLGDENALGFSLCFDTNQLTLLRVMRGVGVSNNFPAAQFTANTNQAGAFGRAGITLGLDLNSPPETWPAGTNVIVEVLFRAKAGTGSTSSTVAICNTPVLTEISDPDANVLLATSNNATVFIQGPCAYGLNTNAASFLAGGGSNTVSVTTDPGCAWTIENTNAWITITSGAGGSGSGAVDYSVAANPDFNPRSATLQIAGQTFTVSQAGFVCAYSVIPATRSHGYGAATNFAVLSAGSVCAWTVVNTNPWVTILSATSGSGNAVIDYSVAANPTIVSRTGVVMIADQLLTLIQDPLPCTYHLSPTNRNHGFGGASNAVTVTAPAACGWTATTTNDWLVLVSGTNGAGNGTVGYTVLANPDNAPRSGAIFVADQVFTITEAAAPCNATLTPSSRAHGFGSETGLVNVALPNGCAWATVNTNFWITIDSGANGTGGGTVGYTVASNPVSTARSGVLTIAGANFTVTKAAAPCPATITPTNFAHSSTAETNTVTVTIGAGCAWTTSNTNAWVSISSGATGTGSGLLTYSVTANTNPAPRSGGVIIAGEILSLTQAGAPCNLRLSPTNRNHGYGATSNSFAVAALAGCAWDVVNTNSWIIILSGTTGTGNGTVTYSNIANPTGNSRSGTLLVGDQTFLINQGGAPCTYTISPSSRTHGFATATNTVSLSTISGCSWTISNLNSWITFPAGTNGNGSLINTYTVAANPDPVGRTGLVMLADKTLTLIQNPAPCSYALTPASQSHGAGVETGLVSVTAYATCAWTATTTNSWISINSGGSGTGNGGVGYTVQANTNGTARNGTLTIGAQTFTVTQAGAPCSFVLSPTNDVHSFNSETTTVSVATLGGCAWTVSNTNSWITIRSSTNGSGSGSVTYSVSANASTLSRSAVIIIAGQPFDVAQAGAPCTYTLSPIQRTHGPGTASNSVTVQAGLGCDWTASTTNSWLVLTGATNGTGTNIVNYAVAANSNPADRLGALFIGGQTFVITQRALVCAITLSPTNRAHGYGAATNTISVTANGTGCDWSASTTDNWIALSGTNGLGDGAVTYVLAANPALTGRTGTVQIADKIFTITQSGAPCSFTLVPASRTHGYGATTNTVDVTTVSGCAWTVSNTNSWITLLSPTNNTGAGVVTYALAGNFAMFDRTGTVMIADQVFTLVQHGVFCSYSLSPTNRTHGPGSATNSVALTTLAGCAWEVVNTNNWITISPATNGTGSATVSYIVEANTSVAARTGVVVIGGEILTLTQQGVPCTFDVSPLTRTHGNGAATNSWSVSTQAGCAWTVANTNSWMTILSALTNTGDGSVTYVVTANASIFARTGLVTVADQVVTLVQQGTPCTFGLSPSTRSHGYGPATNSVNLTTTAGCAWNVVNTNSWITLLSPTNNAGGGLVSYTLDANPATLGRTGTVLIADQVLTLVQLGAPCTYNLSPKSRTHGPGTTSSGVALTALPGCGWDVINTNSWITINSPTNGTDDTTVIYSLAANPTVFARVGTVLIGGESFTLTQNGVPCAFTVSPLNRAHGNGAATNSVGVTAPDGCAWTVSTSNAWITILSPTNNTGTGSVTYAVAANATLFARTGLVMVADEVVTLVQQGTPCTYAMAPGTRTHGYGTTTNSVNLTAPAGCAWTVANTNAWITLLSPTNNNGAGVVIYAVEANATILGRTGLVMMAGQVFTLVQLGAPCTYDLSPRNRAHGSGAASSGVILTTLAGCVWDVVNTNSWITINSPTNGADSTTVIYSLDANPTVFDRVGVVLIGGETFTLTQHGVPCDFVVSPLNRTHGNGTATNTVSVAVQDNCAWTVSNSNAWITVLSPTNNTGTGSVTYAVAANPSSLDRTGLVMVADEVVTLVQQGVPCAFAISPAARTHGNGAATNTVDLAAPMGCLWSASTTNNWITLLSPSINSGSNTVTYALAANPATLERTGTVLLANQVFTLVQHGAPCTYSLSPTNRTHGSGSATNSVTLTTLADCPWNVSNTNSWITITAATNGTGSVIVGYTVEANPTVFDRTGIVTIDGGTFTVTQLGAACAFAVSPLNRAHGYGAATNSIGVTTPDGCAWAVSNTNPWITILSALNNTNAGSVTYTVAANPTIYDRTGLVQVANQTVTLVQSGVPCTFDVTPSARTHGYRAVTNSVELTTLAGCAWTVATTNSWISILSPASGAGPGTVLYALSDNPTIYDRTGAVLIAGQVLTLVQHGGPCTYSLSPTNRTHGFGDATNFVTLTAPAGCPWTAFNTNDWITLAQTNGTGGTNIDYVVAANPFSVWRTGTVVIAGETLTIQQRPLACVYSILPTNALHGAGAESGIFSVATGQDCDWAATTADNWITLTAGTNNTGLGDVHYSLAANPAGVARTGSVAVADQIFPITQQGQACAFNVAPLSQAYASAAATGTVSVTTLAGCAWTATTTNGWLTILTPTNGSAGSGAASYAVAANPFTVERVGFLFVAGQTLVVTQQAAACTYSINPSSRAHGAGAEAGLVNVLTSNNCPWSVLNTNSWITITSATNGVGDGSVAYTVAANPAALARAGVVRIAGQNFSVTQSAAACTFALVANGAAHGAGQETNSVGVTTLAGCAWSVVNTNPWITILSPTNSTNSGPVTYRVQSNATALSRSGVIVIAGLNFTVTQSGAVCTFSLSSSNASFAAAATNGSVTVTTLIGCTWNVANTNPWISILSSLSNSNSGTVNFSVQSNSTALGRSGVVSVAGQNFTVTQSGAACSFTLAAGGAAYSADATNGSVTVTTLIGCAWSVVNTNPWISILSPFNNTNSADVDYSVLANPTALSRTGVVSIASQNFTVTQSGAACTYTLSTNSAAHTAAAETNSLTVTTLLGCSWTVANTNPWISVLSAISNTNSGTVTYRVLSNSTALSRSGVVTVAGQNFTVIQSGAACAFTLAANSASISFVATNSSVGVTTLVGCAWSVVKTNPWIAILSSLNNSNSGTVNFGAQSNPTALARSGVVSIAGLNFTVTQSGTPCTYALSTNNAAHSALAESNSVTVTTLVGCAWSVVNTNPWVTILSSLNNSNSSDVSYGVLANPTALARTGVVSIAGLNFTVSQAGAPCSFTLSTNSAGHTAAAETNSVTVTTLIGCAWNVANANAWISILSATNATNSGPVTYSVQANPTALARSGVVSIAGQSFSVTQAGAACTFALASNSIPLAFNSATGSVAVSTLVGCTWSVVNTNPWITILSSLNNSNSGTVSFSVPANPTSLARTGVVGIAGINFTVSQAGAPCTFTLSTNSAAHGAGAETNALTVTTLIGCAWSVVNTNPWISILSATSNTNSGSVNYSVLANPTALSRTGVVSIAGQNFTVTQSGAACTFALSTNSAAHGAGAETNSLTVTTLIGCPWSVVNTNPWISILTGANATNSGTVSYSVLANPTALARSGVVTVAGQNFSVTQAGAACTFTLATNSASVSFVATNSSVAVTTLVGCTWSVANTNPWITILSSLNNSNSGTVSFSVLSNSTALARTGVVSIAGQSFTVSQSGAPCSYVFSTNSAAHSALAETNSFTVTTLVGCSWNVATTNLWISILSAASNTNSGSVSYGVAANPTALSRTGVVSVAGQNFTVTQSGAACSYSLSTGGAAHGAGVETNSVGVITLVGCPWSVANPNGWITILTPLSSTNSGTVSYSVGANISVLARTGVVSIAGQSFTVTQAAGLACTLSLQASNWTHRALAESGAIGVISPAGCSWGVSNTNSWVTINSGATIDGSGHVFYSLAANTDGNARSGFVNVGGAAFALTQVGTNCTYRLSTTNRVHGSGTNNNTIGITVSNGCSWVVVNTNDWIFITTNSAGNGNATAGYSIAQNPGVNPRYGYVNVGGATIFITQWGTGCGFSANPPIRAHGYAAETNAIALNASSAACAWSVINTNPWITNLSPTSGTGTGIVTYAVSANPSGSARQGVFTIGGALITVNQAGQPCFFTLSSSNAAHGASAETNSVGVTSGVGCVWNVLNTNAWITITAGLSGTNNGGVTYTVAANPTIIPRAGVVSIAGSSFTVSQAGAPCTYALTPALNAHGFGSETGLVSVATLAGCNWNTINTNGWITITSGANGIGGGNVTYSVTSNANVLGRTGFVVIASQVFEVDQAGAPCSFTLSSSGAAHGGGAENGGVTLTTDPLCNWTVVNTNAWITLTAGNGGAGSVSVNYSVAANPVFSPRSGVVVIAGRPFTVTQAAKPCTYVLSPSGVTHGSAPASGSIAVTASNVCSWTVSTTSPWITLTSPTNGFGLGTVTYNVATNGGALRNGTIFIGGTAFPIIQAGSLRVVRAVDMSVQRGQTNKLRIVLEATGIENALGFSLQFDTNHLSYVSAVRGIDTLNSGSTTFTPNASAANLALGRVGVAIGLDYNNSATYAAGSNVVAEISFRAAAGASFTNTTISFINQPIVGEISDLNAVSLAATYVPATVNILGTCTYAVNTNAASFVANGGSGGVNVAAQMGCAWTVSNPNSWITITSATNGVSNGTVTFTVAVNPGGLPRSGALAIAGQTFTVSQAGQPCTYALTATNHAHGFAADAGVVSVVSIPGCSWTVLNTNPWVTITSATNGAGSGDVTYSLTFNPTIVPRSGVLVVAGQNFTISQAGSTCSYTITPTNRAHGFASETGLVIVASPGGCDWTVDHTNAWVLITSTTNGSGNGGVAYLVGYNPDNLGRTGTVMIAGQQFTLTQPANACPITLPFASRNHGGGAETNSFAFTVSACAWTVSNTNAWINITSATNGSGNGTVNYIITANPTLSVRSAVIRVSGREFTVTQDGAACLTSLSASGQAHGFGVENGLVTLSTVGSCNWTVVNTNPWVTLTSATSGTTGADITYTVANNPSSLARTGTVLIAGQTFTLTQTGAPCTFALTPPSVTPGFTAQTATVTVATLAGCRWTVSNTNPWITIQSATTLTNSGSVTYSVASNGTALTRTGSILMGDQTFSVSQSGVPCVVSLNPTNRAHSYKAATNLNTVAAPIGCAWTVNNTNPWVTILSGPSGTGTGLVTYAVSANPVAYARTGLVDIAGQILTLTQTAAPCTYTLSATNVLVSDAGNFTTLDLTTLDGCPWTFDNTNAWIDFFGATGGSGSWGFIYSVNPNSAGAARTGLVQIAGQTFTVRQLGAPCTLTLSATNALHSPAPETNAFTVTALAGCAWTASTTNNWINLLTGTNYTGTATLTYAVSSNALATARTGTVLVVGAGGTPVLPFTVAQTGITCSYSISPSSATHSSITQTGLVSVTSTGNCTWVVVNTNAWIAIKSGGVGTNSGLLRYTAAANPLPSARQAYLLVAGQPFSITQLGSACSYTLSATGRLHSSLFDTGQVSVLTVAECNWSVNNTNDWITITSATNGFGTAIISYSVQFNPGFADRTGVFIIGDQNYTVTQLGAACSYSFPTNSAAHGALSETGTVSVVVPAGCSWTAVKTNSWITILSGGSGMNSGLLTYSVGVNVSGTPRVGYITVGGTPFSITQATVFCTFAVTPASLAHGFEAENGAVSVTTSNVCPWTVLKTNSWITLLNGSNFTGNATVNYQVAANPGGAPRTGYITVAGQTVTVVQAGLVCSYTITPSGRAHSFLAATGQVVVTSPTLCNWNVIKTNSWITILTSTAVTGSNTVSYSVAQNPSATPRSGVVTVAGRAFSLVQNGAPFVIASNKTFNCDAAWNFDPPVNAGNCATQGQNVFVVSTTTNFGCGPTYVAIRSWDATDGCGNHIVCTQVVTVVTPPPIIFCSPSKTVECGQAWSFDAPPALEYCGGTNIVPVRVVSTVTTTNGLCGSTFIVTRTWEATDSCSNKSQCSQSVFVVDTTPPVPVCSPNKTVECGNPWSFDPPTATDACSGTNVTIRVFSSVTNLTGSCGYTATRVWEIFDPCTNRTTCTQIVTAVDTTPPAITSPANKTVECGQAWSFDPPTASDNCLGVVTPTILSTFTNVVGSCGTTYSATRTWQAADGCGNLSFASQTVRIVDTTPPVATCSPNKTMEFGTAWNFDAPTGTDFCGGTNVTVRVLSTATNAAGSCGPGFTATRVWELADACTNKVTCTQIVTVRDTSPPVLTCVSNKNINCLGAWTFDAPTVFDIGSGTNVPVVVISTTTNGTCGSGFTATCTWRATDSCGNSVTCSQTVFGRAIIAVSGTVFCPTNYPATLNDKRVPGAVLLGPTNTTATSKNDGTYDLVFDAASNVVVNPLAPSGGTPSDGVTTLDISLVRRHILSVTSLDSPYKLLAADVDGSGSVSTLDLSFMRRLVLGITNRLPAGLWRFVPSNYTFTNPLAPWNAPTNRVYPGVAANISGQDFVALKLGDVNNSMTALAGPGLSGATPKAAKTAVTFQVGSVTNATGTGVVVQVSVQGFSHVTTAQGTLTWDPAVVRFAGTEQLGLESLSAGSFGTMRAAEGRLSFSWDDPNAQGVSAPDGTVIFAVRFELIGGAGSASTVALLDSVAVREASVNFSPAAFRAVDGLVSIGSPSGPSSTPRLSQAAFSSGVFGMSVPTVSGQNYILEFTESLPATNWTALPALPGDGSVRILNDPSPQSRQRFYRLKIEASEKQTL